MSPRAELLPGTLDMLILRTLADGPLHGYGIAQRIRVASEEVLQVEQGSLYPALYRMEGRGWIQSSWGHSETKRRVKTYTLTPDGRDRLAAESGNWSAFVDAVQRVMGE